MTLFFISLALVAISSFFITTTLEHKEFIKSIIYFFTIMFANVVLTFETLSLFSAISEQGILAINILITIICAIYWTKRGKPLPSIEFKPFFTKLFNTLKRDKFLIILGASFIFMCLISLFLISIMPVVNPDAEAYHAVRSLFWISNGNLNHFDIGDIRNLPMPINSEILYAWIFALIKKQVWLGIFPFIGFMLAITSLYGIMTYIKIPERKKLWALLIMSSFPSVIVQISGTETDIIISGLVLSSIYLYWNALENEKNSTIFMSALSYALAIGTKTPSIMLIPPVGLWMIGMSYYYKKKEFYKPFLKFISFGIINFTLFSAYNYILNFINYGNIAGQKEFLNAHRNLYGIKGMCANFVKHIFLFFDFSGFKWNNVLGPHIVNLKTNVLQTIGLGDIPDGVHSKSPDYVNGGLLEPLMGLGILGFLAFLPSWINSLIAPLFTKKKRDWLICSFGLILLGGIICMSLEIMFMNFNIRFLTSFCVIATPVLVYSYPRKNKFFKVVITLFALYGLLLISTHLWARPAGKIIGYLRKGSSISEVREIAKCSLFFRTLPKNPIKLNETCKMESKIRSFDKRNKILYFSNNSDTIFIIKLLQFEGYQVDFGLLENINDIDLSKYNIIILLENKQLVTTIYHSDRSYYSPTTGVSCAYMNLNDGLYIPQRDKIPYIIKCEALPVFFNNNNYKLFTTLETTLRQNKDSYTIKYRFYENTKNPIVK